MTGRELRIDLAKRGCIFSSRIAGSNHIMVEFGNRVAQLPMHDQTMTFDPALIEKIYADLGLSSWQGTR